MRVASTRKIHHEDNNKEVKKYYHLSLHTKQDKDDANGKAEQSDKVFNDDGIEVWWKCEVEGCEYDHGTILVSDKNKAQRKYAHKQRQKNDEVPDNPPMKEKSQEQSPAKKKQRKVRTPKKRDNNGQQDVEEEANPKQEPKKAVGVKPKAMKSTFVSGTGPHHQPALHGQLERRERDVVEV